MSRRRRAKKHPVLPDPKFGNTVLTKFMNCLMYKGKKAIAERIVYDALELAHRKLKRDPIEIFQTALNNIKPQIEVRSRRVGGSTYQIPVEVRFERAQTLAIRWLIIHTRKRHEKTMSEKLCAELLDAFNQKGNAIKKRDDTHKMAEANRAFSHYRW